MGAPAGRRSHSSKGESADRTAARSLELVMKLIEQVESERDAVLKKDAPADEAEGMIRSLRSCGLSVRTSLRFSCVRRSYGSFAIDARLADMSGLAGLRSRAAAANANKGSGKTAKDGFARRWSNLPGCGALAAGQRLVRVVPRACRRMGGRIRKIMIVALARKLLVALWRYVKDGVVPEGAKMKPA